MSISLENVTYTYRRSRRPALRDLSVDISAPATVLLGPNGAGKSTLMKVIVGMIKPHHGKVVLPEKIGYTPQQVAAIRGFSCLEQVTYAGWLQGMPTRSASERAREVLDLVRLGDQADQRVGRISGGQLRRVGIAEALIASQECIVLDEPTAGLDPEQRHNLREVLTELTSAGVKIVISTHQTDDLSELYDEVIVIRSGRVLFSGSVANFLSHSSGEKQSAERAYLSLMEMAK